MDLVIILHLCIFKHLYELRTVDYFCNSVTASRQKDRCTFKDYQNREPLGHYCERPPMRHYLQNFAAVCFVINNHHWKKNLSKWFKKVYTLSVIHPDSWTYGQNTMWYLSVYPMLCGWHEKFLQVTLPVSITHLPVCQVVWYSQRKSRIWNPKLGSLLVGILEQKFMFMYKWLTNFIILSMNKFKEILKNSYHL